MWLDVLVLIIAVVAVFKGLTKGLVVGVFSFIAFIVGLAAALKLSTMVAGYIGQATNISGRLLPVAAFFIVFLVVALLISLGAKMIEKALQLALLGCVNRLGGAVFYVLIYLFIFSILLFYAEGLHMVKPESVEASVTYPYLKPLAPKVINAVGIVLPFFKNMFAELLHFFQNVADKAPNQQYTWWQMVPYHSAFD